MSEKFPEPDLPESDKDLESLLKQLKPNPLEFGLLRELEAEYEATVEERAEAPNSLQWKRLAPLAFVGLLGMLAYASYQYGPHLNPEEEVVADTPGVSSQKFLMMQIMRL